mmetsp:Transcript_11985/g.25760  ORF Transcript_11985/g.25760 Transcript_11985/m.25760 type:complete len:214 (-) Transcript_11985:13-654(-)
MYSRHTWHDLEVVGGGHDIAHVHPTILRHTSQVQPGCCICPLLLRVHLGGEIGAGSSPLGRQHRQVICAGCLLLVVEHAQVHVAGALLHAALPLVADLVEAHALVYGGGCRPLAIISHRWCALVVSGGEVGLGLYALELQQRPVIGACSLSVSGEVAEEALLLAVPQQRTPLLNLLTPAHTTELALAAHGGLPTRHNGGGRGDAGVGPVVICT